MTRFLVTGASGLLGLNFGLEHCQQHEVVGVVNHHGLQGVPFGVMQNDLTRDGEIERVLDEAQPEVILNCAALALPDQCEKNPELAARLNAWMPGRLAAAARERGMRLVHISTDAVFDGQKGDYRETDRVHPLNHYSNSKLAGEEAVLSADPRALVARVVFYGWSLRGERSLSEFFFYNLAAGKPVQGFTDAIFSPLLVNDLAVMLAEMVEARLSGIYHVYSREPVSKYEFGRMIARRFGLDEALISPTSVHDGGLAARRSPNLSMNVDKLTHALNRVPPAQAEGIDRLAQLWEAGYAERLKTFAA